ncbi:putative short chain dehydrogenase/ reductase [Xylariaceae sp. FL0804]|nr:putative short chain dehydrogenase/ reductase [Xylariaceae sp. FL0804]
MLYYVAGGCHAENRFLVDITTSDLESCIRNNYFTAVYAAKFRLDIWIEDDKKEATAFAGSFPNGRAEVLEALRYSNAWSRYTIHCAFPGGFVSPGFNPKQNSKTELTRRMQGFDGKSITELEARYPSSDEVAALVVAGVRRGDSAICKDSLAATLLFTSMGGSSTKRGWGLLDSLVVILSGRDDDTVRPLAPAWTRASETS